MANRLLVRIPVIPFHNQVSIGDYKETSVPEWDSAGHTKGVVASDSHLLVATCNDADSHVVVDVYAGEPSERHDNLIFDGTLRVDSQALTIRSVTVDPSRILLLPRPGTWQVKVFVDPERQARHVTMFIEDYEDEDMPDDPWMWP
jgi:hypothetical protein